MSVREGEKGTERGREREGVRGREKEKEREGEKPSDATVFSWGQNLCCHSKEQPEQVL